MQTYITPVPDLSFQGTPYLLKNRQQQIYSFLSIGLNSQAKRCLSFKNSSMKQSNQKIREEQ